MPGFSYDPNNPKAPFADPTDGNAMKQKKPDANLKHLGNALRKRKQMNSIKSGFDALKKAK